MKAAITTKGFESQLEKLARAGANIDESAARALLAGTQPMKTEMQRLAPKDTHNLEQHIAIDGPHQDGNFHSIEVGLIHKKAFTDAETARYGTAQEYGTATMAAQPYIRPGAAKAKSKARRAMRESLEQDGVITK